MKSIFFIFLSIFLFTACSTKTKETQINTSQLETANYLNSSNKLIHAIALYEKEFKENPSSNTALELARIFRYKVFHEKEMIKWYEKAITLESLDAKYELAIYFYEKDDLQKAISYFKKLPKEKYSFSHIQKKPNSKQLKAIKFFMNEYKNKKPNAAFRLATIYKDELKDIKNTIYWYKKSYEAKNPYAATFLGSFYEKDLKSYENALKWYKIAYKSDTKVASSISHIYKNYIKDVRQVFIWNKK